MEMLSERCDMRDVIMVGRCVDAQMLPMKMKAQKNRKKNEYTNTGLSPLDPNKNNATS
jgi:hypothetical protein